MTNIATRNQLLQNIAQGKAVLNPLLASGSTSGTAAAVTSGRFSMGIQFGAGTTIPGTLTSMVTNDVANNQLMMVSYSGTSASAISGIYGRIYRIGGVVLTATGNQFTHDAATFPLTRTIMGMAGAAVNLIPLVFVTTALTTTAAAFILDTAVGGNGYTNQSGVGVVGSTTFTFPSTTTATGSTYIPMLNTGDSAIQDIAQVNVTVSSATGAFDIYGFEPYAYGNNLSNSSLNFQNDVIYGGCFTQNNLPAVATSGTATSYKVIISYANPGGTTFSGFDLSVQNI